MRRIIDSVDIRNKDTNLWVRVFVVINMDKPPRDNKTIIRDVEYAGFLVLPFCHLKPT